MKTGRVPLVGLSFGMLVASGLSLAVYGTERVPNKLSLPLTGQVALGSDEDVCAAATQPVGSEVTIRGEMGGWIDYGRHILTLYSDRRCGPGNSYAPLGFITMTRRSDFEVLRTVKGRVSHWRRQRRPGDILEIRGTLTSVEQDGRVVRVGSARLIRVIRLVPAKEQP